MTQDAQVGAILRSPDDLARALRARFSGEIVSPGDKAYEAGRAVWNGMIDRRPRLIARCNTVADVVEAVRFATEKGLVIAVRGGGHNVAGFATCDGGLVIDLGPMSRVEVDAEARLARVQGGARWADVDAVTQRHGLATPGGVVSDTGVAGLTLCGGLSWLRNKLGLSSDNLVAAEVVTADGRVLRASATENPDLLWGIRGGGGNFGVVTSFEFRLHPIGPEIMFCMVFHHGDNARDALRFLREYTEAAPDEISVLAFLGVVPPGAEAFPEESHGMPFVAFGGIYAGPVEVGERVVEPLRRFSAKPLIDFSGPLRYVDAQKFFDEDYPAHSLRYYWKSLNLLELGDSAIDLIVEHSRRQPSPLSTTDLWHNAGAIREIADDATAFSGRAAPFVLNPEGNWSDPSGDEENVAWVRDFVAAMAPFSDGSRYMNFAGLHEEGEEAMRATHGAKYRRLVDLKNKFDPNNVFSLNQNVSPSLKQTLG